MNIEMKKIEEVKEALAVVSEYIEEEMKRCENSATDEDLMVCEYLREAEEGIIKIYKLLGITGVFAE